MPELGPYGSVRGALSNERPYRDFGVQNRIFVPGVCRPATTAARVALSPRISHFVVIDFDLRDYGPEVGSPRLYVAGFQFIPHEAGEGFEAGGGNRRA